MNAREYFAGITSAPSNQDGRAIPSLCTANEFVHRAGLQFAASHELPVLIEATSNQINQFGGYTGVRPVEFLRRTQELSRQHGLPPENLLLGGDHLGPNPWKSESETAAMNKADELVREAVRAGYAKIHLDASMPLGSEAGHEDFSFELIAKRQAQLCEACEDELQSSSGYQRPMYVIGSEVPPPGGTTVSHGGVAVTHVSDFVAALETTKAAFISRGLEDAWQRVRAIVVQPGVEFGQASIHEYAPASAAALVESMRARDELVFEAHSTDYQTGDSLRNLVEDGCAIIKVGPELTFAFREALFLLEFIEQELLPDSDTKLSNLQTTLENVMIENPKHWSDYYEGDETERRLARKFAFSDRIRYYWDTEDAKAAISQLLSNLRSVTLPPSLVHQFFPEAGQTPSETGGPLEPERLIQGRINVVLRRYYRACGFSFD